jgi:hypothetical protein
VELTDLHLADLHQRAREAGVPRYRMLTRDDLIAAIEERAGADVPAGRDEATEAGFERPLRREERGPTSLPRRMPPNRSRPRRPPMPRKSLRPRR